MNDLLLLRFSSKPWTICVASRFIVSRLVNEFTLHLIPIRNRLGLSRKQFRMASLIDQNANLQTENSFIAKQSRVFPELVMYCTFTKRDKVILLPKE